MRGIFSDVQTVADQVRTLHVSEDNCVGTIHGAGFGEPQLDEPVEPGDLVLDIFDAGGVEGRFIQVHAHSTQKGAGTL